MFHYSDPPFHLSPFRPRPGSSWRILVTTSRKSRNGEGQDFSYLAQEPAKSFEDLSPQSVGPIHSHFPLSVPLRIPLFPPSNPITFSLSYLMWSTASVSLASSEPKGSVASAQLRSLLWSMSWGRLDSKAAWRQNDSAKVIPDNCLPEIREPLSSWDFYFLFFLFNTSSPFPYEGESL